jgi:hypothetical protein
MVNVDLLERGNRLPHVALLIGREMKAADERMDFCDSRRCLRLSDDVDHTAMIAGSQNHKGDEAFYPDEHLHYNGEGSSPMYTRKDGSHFWAGRGSRRVSAAAAACHPRCAAPGSPPPRPRAGVRATTRSAG